MEIVYAFKSVKQLNEELVVACRDYDMSRVKSLIWFGANDFKQGLEIALLRNYVWLADLMAQKIIKKYTTIESNEIIKDAISIGFTRYSIHSIMKMTSYININVPFIMACSNRDFQLIEAFISQGANDWQGAFREACRHRHKDLQLMSLISHEAVKNNFKLDFNSLLYQVCRGPYDELGPFFLIFKYLMRIVDEQKVPYTCLDWDLALKGAHEGFLKVKAYCFSYHDRYEYVPALAKDAIQLMIMFIIHYNSNINIVTDNDARHEIMKDPQVKCKYYRALDIVPNDIIKHVFEFI
jgi:hypothetical protein